MSKAEILQELPKLSREERAEIQARLDDLAGDGWLDDGELTEQEKRLLDSRLDACERSPSSFVPWEEAKSRIAASLKKCGLPWASYRKPCYRKPCLSKLRGNAKVWVP